MRGIKWVFTLLLSIATAVPAFADCPPSVHIKKPVDDQDLAIKNDFPGQGRYFFNADVVGEGVVSIEWTVSPSSKGTFLSNGGAGPVTYQALQMGDATIRCTVYYRCPVTHEEGSVSDTKSVHQFKLTLLDDDGNHSLRPPLPEETGSGNLAPFQHPITQQYSIEGPAGGLPVTVEFKHHTLPVGTGVLSYPQSETRNTTGTFTIGNVPQNGVMGIGMSSFQDDVELDIRIVEANEADDNVGIGHTRNFTVADIAIITLLEYGQNAAFDPDEGYHNQYTRMFPDAINDWEGDQHRDYVTVRATTNPPMLGGIWVWMRAYDVDDPSASDAPVDPNDAGGRFVGDDNYGAASNYAPGWVHYAATGLAGYACMPVTVTGVSEEYRVSINPGDNFRFAVSFAPDFLAATHEDDNVGNELLTPTGVYLNDTTSFTAKASDTIIVWRKLHMELDRMAAFSSQAWVDENTQNATATDMTAAGVISCADELQPGDTSAMAALATIHAAPALGRFESGRVRLRNWNTLEFESVFSNASQELCHDAGNVSFSFKCYLRQTPESDAVYRHFTKLTHSAGNTDIDLDTPLPGDFVGGVISIDNDEYEITAQAANNLTVTVGDTVDFDIVAYDDDAENLATNPLRPSTLAMQEDSDHDLNCWADAFIWPLDDDGTNPGWNEPANVGLHCTVGDFGRFAFSSKGSRSDRYWIAYAVAGYEDGKVAYQNYQGTLYGADLDPETELMQTVGGWTNQSDGSIGYEEQLRDFDAAENWNANGYDLQRAYVYAHEIGHQFGLSHLGAFDTIMGHGVGEVGTNPRHIYFGPDSIHHIRLSPASPGYRDNQ